MRDFDRHADRHVGETRIGDIACTVQVAHLEGPRQGVKIPATVVSQCPEVETPRMLYVCSLIAPWRAARNRGMSLRALGRRTADSARDPRERDQAVVLREIASNLVPDWAS